VRGTAGLLRSDVNRQVPIGITLQPNSGQTNGSNFSLAVETSYNFMTGFVTHGPLIGAVVQRVHVDDFTETGSLTNTNLIGDSLGTNIFQLGVGAETASGGSRSNTFQMSSGTGQAEIALSSATGAHNEIDFTGNISDQNLWFQRSGNNLQIDLIGTNTSATVDNWFSGSSGQLQEITAGGLKIDSQISQLVQAMAGFGGGSSTGESLNTAPLSADTSQQPLLTTPQHA